MAIDVVRVMPGQIWLYDDNVDKHNTEQDDVCIRGKRPVLVLTSSGSKITCVPFTSSNTNRYNAIDSSIQFHNRSTESYAIIDNIITVNEAELEDYIATCKTAQFEKIKIIVTDYILGKIVFAGKSKQYKYISDIRKCKQDDIESGEEEIDNTNIVEEPETKSKTKAKYSDEDLEYMATHQIPDIMKKYPGITKAAIYSARNRYRRNK